MSARVVEREVAVVVPVVTAHGLTWTSDEVAALAIIDIETIANRASKAHKKLVQRLPYDSLFEWIEAHP